MSTTSGVGPQGAQVSNGGGNFQASLTNASANGVSAGPNGAQSGGDFGIPSNSGPTGAGSTSGPSSTPPLFGQQGPTGTPPGADTGFGGVKKGLEEAGASKEGLEAFDKATGLLNKASESALKDGTISEDEIPGIMKGLGKDSVQQLKDLAKGPLAQMKGLTPEFDEFMKGLDGLLNGKKPAEAAEFLNKGLGKAEEMPGEMPPAGGEMPPAGAPPAGAPPAGAPPAGAPPAGAPPAGGPEAGGPPGAEGAPEGGAISPAAQQLMEEFGGDDGVIDKDEMKDLAKKLAEMLGISEEEAMKMLQEAAGEDGKLSGEELTKLLEEKGIDEEKLKEFDEEMGAEGEGETDSEVDGPSEMTNDTGTDSGNGTGTGADQNGASVSSSFSMSDPTGGLIPGLPKAA